MQEAPWVAFDLEANSMFVYRERVCLIQINAGGQLFVIDTLALPDEANILDPLKANLEDPQRPLWLHGGEYDVACLKRDYGMQCQGVFDTQQAASMLGWEKTGYGAVVERVCAVTLPKGHSQYNWGTRPLDADALAYAIDDVRHLPTVAEHLKKAVEEADLSEEVSIANGVVEAAGWSGGFDPAGFWRLKGIRELNNRALPTLAALWAWRDSSAKAYNLPPGRVVANELLLALARNAPTNWGSLRKLGVKSWLVQDHGDALIELFKVCRDDPPPVPERSWMRESSDVERARENRLKDWRRAEAERRGVPLQVVLPARALDHLKFSGAEQLESAPQLGPKRIALYGDELRKIC
jgi:ribonuclease D